MKKMFLLCAALTAITTIACAGDEIKVPRGVVYEFRRQFGMEAAVKWKKIDNLIPDDKYYIAHFIQNGIWTEAFFGESGEYLGAGKSISINQIPGSVKSLQQNRFSGYIITEAYEYFSKNSEVPVYGFTIIKGDRFLQVKVNESGNISVLKRLKAKKSYPLEY